MGRVDAQEKAKHPKVSRVNMEIKLGRGEKSLQDGRRGAEEIFIWRLCTNSSY